MFNRCIFRASETTHVSVTNSTVTGGGTHHPWSSKPLKIFCKRKNQSAGLHMQSLSYVSQCEERNSAPSEISQMLISKDTSYPARNAVLNPYHDEKIFAWLSEDTAI